MQMCAVYSRKLIIQDVYCSALNIISSTRDRKKARHENSLYLSPGRSLSLPLNLHSGLHSSLHLSLLGSANKTDRFLQRRMKSLRRHVINQCIMNREALERHSE